MFWHISDDTFRCYDAQEIETFRENEKSRWQSFTQKVGRRVSFVIELQLVCLQSSKSKGALNGKQKKSIFAVPDSLTGRVS